MELKVLLFVPFLLGSIQGFNSSLASIDQQKLPQSCLNISGSGIKLIHPQPDFGSPFKVLCDDKYEGGGGWIVIQQRFNGRVQFYRGWKSYEDGFGDLRGEFWLGLKRIHELTYSNKYQLHVELEDWDGYKVNAKYSSFLVAGPEEKYRLRSLGQYSGTAGDSLSFSVGMQFSTLDADNDTHDKVNCARDFQGAWWYEACHDSNLNGKYVKGEVSEFALMMCWRAFRGYYYGLKTSRMLIREVK